MALCFGFVAMPSVLKQQTSVQSNRRNGQSKRIEDERIDLRDAVFHNRRVDSPEHCNGEQVEVRPESGRGILSDFGHVSP